MVKSEKFLKFLIALTIVTVPLYPKFPLINVSGTFVSVRLEDFLILAALIFSFVNLNKWLNLRIFFKQAFLRNIFLYLGVCLLSVISAVFLTQTINLNIGLLHLFRRVEYFSMGIVIYFYLKKYPKDSLFFVSLIIPVILYSFVYGYGQKHFSWPIIITQNQEYSKGVALKWIEGSHINSTFAGHYDLATYLVFVMPIVVSMFYFAKKFKQKYILLVVFFSALWLLVNSASRISLVSFLGASTFALLLQKKYKEIIPLVIAAIIFINFSSNLLTRYSRIFQVVRDYISTNVVLEVQAQESTIRRNVPLPTPTPIPVFEDRSTSIRLNVEWPRAIRAFTKNPFLGTGFSSITLATDNDYLRLLGETGILGFFSFMMIILEILAKYIKFIKLRSEINTNFILITSLIGGLFGVLLNAVFIDVFEASKFAISFWIFIGIGLSIAEGKKISPKKINEI